MSNPLMAKGFPLFLSADVAKAYAEIGKTQDVGLFNTLTNKYVANRRWENSTPILLGIGFQTYDNDKLIYNTSLKYIPIRKMSAKGDVWQLTSPLFNNLTYNFWIQSDILLIENIATWKKYAIQPGFIVGLGRSQNSTTHYIETSKNNQAAPMLTPFKNASTAQLAYEFGAVLDYPVKNITYEFAYRFIGAGVGRLGTSLSQNTMQRLSTGTIYYHTVSLGARLYYV